MKTLALRWLALGLLVLITLAAAKPAGAELQWSEGDWRLELTTGFGIDSGKRDRTSNLLLTGSVEYEVPMSTHCTLGFRILPLFLYDQQNDGAEDADTLWGAGVGLAARYYQVADEQRGWYGELQGNLLGHSGKLTGNSASANFLIGAGVGYEFKNSWHAILKYEHISNAGLSENNSGANSIGLGVGYRF